MSKNSLKGTTRYELIGPAGLDLAEAVLIGERNHGKCPQRRPLVLSLEELNVFSFGTIGRELDRAIELLSLRPKERARRLALLRGIKRKLTHL